MDASEGPEVRAERCTGSFTGIAVHLASAIPVIVPCPLVHAMAAGGVGRMVPPIALACVGVQGRAGPGETLGYERRTGALICVVTDPPALLAGLARDDIDDRRPVIGRGPVPFTPIGAAAWRIARVAMGRALFPQRADTVRRPRRRCHASRRWAPSRSGSPACGAGGYALACAIPPVHGRAAPSVHLERCHGAGHQGSRALAGLREGCPGQERVVTIVSPAAVGGKVVLPAEQPPITASAAGAASPLRVQMAFQPDQADAVV